MKRWLMWLILALFLLSAIAVFKIMANYKTEITAGYCAKVKKDCSFRVGPSDSMPNIFYLYKNEKVGVIYEKGDWLYIQFDKYIGFAKKENFVRLDEKFGIHPSLLPRFYFKESDDLAITGIFIFLNDQQIFCFNKDNKLIASGYCVTGKSYTPTLTGDWHIYEKRSPEYLIGADYCVPVSFWMPFCRGQGLHDAYWRTFLGPWEDHNNYGSHGCVNLPYFLAEFIYSHSNIGTKVIVMQ